MNELNLKQNTTPHESIVFDRYHNLLDLHWHLFLQILPFMVPEVLKQDLVLYCLLCDIF